MSDDLVVWLRAQLAEDERTAREAGGAAWEELPVSGWVHTAPLPMTEWQPPGYDHHVASVPLAEDRAHILRHDPAQVLREIDAKRQLLDWLELIDQDAPVLDGAVRVLAQPYAGRPGYREEWRPE